MEHTYSIKFDREGFADLPIGDSVSLTVNDKFNFNGYQLTLKVLMPLL